MSPPAESARGWGWSCSVRRGGRAWTAPAGGCLSAGLRTAAGCAPAKAEGLRAWTRVERVIGPEGIYRVFQHINHVKAVVEDGRITAKAYAAVIAGRPGG